LPVWQKKPRIAAGHSFPEGFRDEANPISKHCISGTSAKTRSFIRSQKKFDGVVSQPRLR